MQQTSTRSWEWTPPTFANAFMSFILRTPLHRVVSGSMLLLTFTGCKSGNHYTTPVGYYRDENIVIILTKWFRKWWRNFQEAAPVELLIAGKNYAGTARALTDEAATIPFIVEMIKRQPYNAEFYGVRMESGNPNMDDVRRIAPKVVAIQVTLAN